MKVVCGLGNPGAEYEDTRHNVGWWAVEAAALAWGFPRFRREGAVRLSQGRSGEETVWLLEPLTYMNRSGSAVARLLGLEDFEVDRDLLVVVDDAALPLGRLRMRGEGSAGGHNGLRSIEAALRRRDYARLRIGVGGAPPGVDLADWVLAPFEPQEADIVRSRLPDVVAGIRTWIDEGLEPAIQRVNATREGEDST